MGDRMMQLTFPQLVEWMLQEKKSKGTMFGVYRPYLAETGRSRTLFGRKLETPVGPAAGPHTQLAQNIAAAYYAGSRFFELKTVQILDGDELTVEKPCIKADDEGYNVEWSTELYVSQAMEEYIKAWFLLHVMAKEYGTGAMDGFQFNMSVGYDLEGIRSEKIDRFIEGMKDAGHTGIFNSCRDYLLSRLDHFERITAEDIVQIPAAICNSVTLSTLHGCPPQEIERIAKYLMEEKGLNTLIKCNPTLLGYPFARKTMDDMGYDYVSFGDFHFRDDLQYGDAVPMLKRLMITAQERLLEFGVKITNTFPVDIKAGELPGKEMYMSGRPLYPLSITLAARLAADFGGRLRISFSGGADYHNIGQVVEAGIWPVTVATTLLKPGGYQRIRQLAGLTDTGQAEFGGVDAPAVRRLAEEAVTDRHHRKAVKPVPSRKMKQPVPLLDCYTEPCKEGCPIHQDITAYIKLAGEGKYTEALKVITEKNPLPFLTGTICAHSCMGRCSRNFYEEPVHIRSVKLLAAEQGYDALLASWKGTGTQPGGKTAAVIGGGPAGLAAAYFLGRGGMQVTIYEKKDCLGGVPRHVIPEFRISGEALDKDMELVLAKGAKVCLGTAVEKLDGLPEQYDAVVLAVGAYIPAVLSLEAGTAVDALAFLEEFKRKKGALELGKHVVVIGGGNTAMDAARAAVRTDGVEKVSLLYRRTKRYMPAGEEELLLALEDGVEFCGLLSPVGLEDGMLLCKVMRLAEPDAAGRCGVIETEETTLVEADTVIAAVGEQVPTDYYAANGIQVDGRGRAVVDALTLETNRRGIYIIGDALGGPATVAEAIRDAGKAAGAILGCSTTVKEYEGGASAPDIYTKRGILGAGGTVQEEGARCLVCPSVCENCAEVCPNRANIAVAVPGMEKHQILHLDKLCNECGNCRSFCPYDSAPYLDKFTLFASEADMENSQNQGFVILDREACSYKVRYQGEVLAVSGESAAYWNIGGHSAEDAAALPPEGIRRLMAAVCRDYAYLV